MNRLFIVLILLSGLIFTGCSTKTNTQQQTKPTTVVSNTTSQPTPMPKPVTSTTTNSAYTLQDVGTHNTKVDCRTIIDSKIFNLTTAFGKHKGGDEALSLLCGIDGTTKFNSQHGTSDKAKGRLTTLQIGTLK